MRGLALPYIGQAQGPAAVFQGAQLMPVQGRRGCVPPEIPEQVLPDAEFDAPYSYQVQAGGSPPLAFAITAGALPAGLTMDTEGLITGTTVDIGEFTFTVTVTNPCGEASRDLALEVVSEEIERLAGLAAMILDFPRGQTTAFTTAAGAVPCTDGQFARSILPEVFPTAGRLVRDADENTWEDDAPSRINGAGIVQATALTTAMIGPANNAGDYLSQTLWWFTFQGRLGGTANNATFVFQWNPSAPRVFMVYNAATNLVRLSVNNGTSTTNYDFVTVAGAVVRLAAYYDGTDLHIWFNSGARVDVAGTGALGSLGGTGGGIGIQRNVASRTVSTSALWCGKLDGGNIAQMLADIAAWMLWKA